MPSGCRPKACCLPLGVPLLPAPGRAVLRMGVGWRRGRRKPAAAGSLGCLQCSFVVGRQSQAHALPAGSLLSIIQLPLLPGPSRVVLRVSGGWRRRRQAARCRIIGLLTVALHGRDTLWRAVHGWDAASIDAWRGAQQCRPWDCMLASCVTACYRQRRGVTVFGC